MNSEAYYSHSLYNSRTCLSIFEDTKKCLESLTCINRRKTRFIFNTKECFLRRFFLHSLVWAGRALCKQLITSCKGGRLRFSLISVKVVYKYLVKWCLTENNTDGRHAVRHMRKKTRQTHTETRWLKTKLDTQFSNIVIIKGKTFKCTAKKTRIIPTASLDKPKWVRS